MSTDLNTAGYSTGISNKSLAILLALAGESTYLAALFSANYVLRATSTTPQNRIFYIILGVSFLLHIALCSMALWRASSREQVLGGIGTLALWGGFATLLLLGQG